ncbi:MAG: BlaI/MecI/CopY family transcriptional regulator [Candidatus Limiplasma sp.]|nr:BlaI/MecI/CopY family transcriptional regulator [Candidatus Limiplasma sp.]
MKRDHVALTEAEWKIMLLLWERSPWTMMELTRALEEETGWSKHTVITMLKRMAVKGTVRICEDGPVKTYFPAVSKDRVAREQTQTLLKRLFSGRASLLVNDMVEQGELNDEELRELQNILDRAEKQKKNRKEEPKAPC